MAASSISSGIAFTNPQNRNTACPAPNPRYRRTRPYMEFKYKSLAVLDMVNITIWNGTIMANTKI